MTSRVETKENDSDDAMYDMLQIYEECEYIMWTINEKKKNNNNKKTTKKNKLRDTHTSQNGRQKSYEQYEQ